MILTALATIAAAAFTGGPAPAYNVDTYDLRVLTGSGFVREVVDGPQRFIVNASDPSVADVFARNGRLVVGATATAKGRRVTGRYMAEPDGVTGPDDLGLQLARFAVTEARAGKFTLTPEVLSGRAVYRVAISLPANACRKLVAGTATLWLTRSTLLPKRLKIVRGGTTQTLRYRFSGFNRDVDFSGFDPPAVGAKPVVVNEGFRRALPAVVAGPLPFTPRLPATLPPGFELAASGWAPLGARTGPGGVNPRDAFLFAAVYTRGWERIEVTQRVATNGTWRRDPFARSCLTMQRGRISAGARPGHYGVGPQITSHLWWRNGGIIFTVSGPYGKRDLQTIAQSLTKIS